MDRLTPANAAASLARLVGQESVSLFRHGSLEVKYYKPDKIDKQRPHARDELYVVASGTGWFEIENHRHQVQPGEVLFAAANVPHRFENFTENFATWVFFYGPDGGEQQGRNRRRDDDESNQIPVRQ